MRHWFNQETGKMLAKARRRAGYDLEEASRRIGFALFFVEAGLISLDLCDVALLAELYRIPQEDLALWQMQVATEVQLRKTRLH